MDFDLSGLDIPDSLHRNGSGTPVFKGRKPIPHFHWKSIISPYHTEREGRPVPVQRLMCTQQCVGSKDQPGDVEVRFITNQLGKVVPDPTNIIVKRYPLELKRFLELGEAPVQGIPLEQWPRMTSDMVAVCHFLEIRTVEQLAGCKGNDAVIGKLGRGGRALVEQADAFINQRNDEAFAQRVAAEKEELRAELEQTKKQQAEILEELRELRAAKAKTKEK
jgi:hypothetical protein